MESVIHCVTIRSNHKDFVANERRYYLRHLHDKSVVGDITRVELCLLVVEPHLTDACEIVTHKTYYRLEVGLGYQRVSLR